MTELLTLGNLFISDFLAPDEQPRADPYPLTLVMDDDTGIVHLTEQPPPDLMWGRYWYRSSTNASMTAALHDVVSTTRKVVHIPDGSTWVDIASNDGTLLGLVDAALPGVVRIGVDPVEGEIYEQATDRADLIIQEPFTTAVAERILQHVEAGGHPVKVITCIAMFYDLLDPTDFLLGVKHLLADDGVFVLQMSYTPLMIEQLAFDNVCHEHARYYSLQTLDRVLRGAGFRIVDATLNDVNGGSFRVVARHVDADPATFASAPYRDVAARRVNTMWAYEHHRQENQPGAWRRFRSDLETLRGEVRSYVKGCRSAGRSVWAYGASTKGNTLLQYFGLDHTLIDGIAERQEAKWGLRTVGTDIPIVSEDEWRAARAHSTLMLPWHFVSEFVARERKYLDDGGRFIVPCPKFEVIGG